MAAQQEQQGIDLATLDVDQLGGLKEQLDQELEQFAESFQQLQTAAQRFHLSGLASENLAKEEAGKVAMVPLTSSLYVSGVLDSTEKVLVDIGTGYYVEKTPEEATSFCKRKVLMLKNNMEKLHELIFEKRQQANQVAQVYQMKQHQQAQQQQKRAA